MYAKDVLEHSRIFFKNQWCFIFIFHLFCSLKRETMVSGAIKQTDGWELIFGQHPFILLLNAGQIFCFGVFCVIPHTGILFDCSWWHLRISVVALCVVMVSISLGQPFNHCRSCRDLGAPIKIHGDTGVLGQREAQKDLNCYLGFLFLFFCCYYIFVATFSWTMDWYQQGVGVMPISVLQTVRIFSNWSSVLWT